MLKQLEISDIDPIIAKLEQGYSDKGHTLNALSHNSLLGLDDNVKAQYLYIAQASDNEQRLVRFGEVVAGLTQEQKWPFIESFSTIIKAMSFIESDNVDNDEGLQDQATQLLNASGYSIDPHSVSYRVLLSKLKSSNDVRDELFHSMRDTIAYITVYFKGTARPYIYSYRKAGMHHVEQMKRLALAGDGLNEYINENVRKAFD